MNACSRIRSCQALGRSVSETQRRVCPALTFLQYSINVQKRPVPRYLHHRPRPNALKASNLQQTRSLSLFGWSSSHPTQEAGSSQQPIYEKWDAGAAPSNPTPIKAVHSTTDTPATATLGPAPEPRALDEIENAIAAASHPSPGAEALLS